MDAQRCVKLWIVSREHGGHSAAGRHASHVDARRIDSLFTDDVPGHGRDQSGIAVVVGPVLKRVPVPAAQQVGGKGLLGIQHEYSGVFRSFVHASAGRELLRALMTAVQQHEQGCRTRFARGRLVEHVPALRFRAEATLGESALRHRFSSGRNSLRVDARRGKRCAPSTVGRLRSR
jgi:hypothetical protein